MKHGYYLFLDLLTLSIPFLRSFEPRVRFWDKYKSAIPGYVLVAVAFLIWDEIFTRIGVWGFNQDYLIGVKVFHLPLEEILFFFAIPYACVFVYEIIKVFTVSRWEGKSSRWITYPLILLLLTVGVFNLDKLYTSMTFISLAIILILLERVLKVKWLVYFYCAYLLLFLPFFLINGALTGMFSVEPVVWYNDLENLGIRIVTIPFEDIFYGMLLILLNVFCFESARD